MTWMPGSLESSQTSSEKATNLIASISVHSNPVQTHQTQPWSYKDLGIGSCVG